MPTEPSIKRAVVFLDGQNLFHAAKQAFGYRFPNYDPHALAREICRQRGFELSEVRFYTGVPDAQDDAFWNHFWAAKLAQMGRSGVHTFSRPLRYRNQTVRLPDGTEHVFLVGQEKGIDVRIALDVVRLAHRRTYDVALVFSQPPPGPLSPLPIPHRGKALGRRRARKEEGLGAIVTRGAQRKKDGRMARISLAIPEAHKKPLAELLSLPGETIQKIIDLLGKMDPVLAVSDLASRVASSVGIEAASMQEIFEMLRSMCLVCSGRAITPSEFADALERAAEKQLQLKNGDWPRFKGQLAQLLSLDHSLGLSAKAFEVRHEQERLFFEGRVITDVRPVFREDVNEPPFGVVIVHTLRLSYHEGPRLMNTYVALGREDLEQLQEVIQRALSKDHTMRSTVEKAGLRCLDVESQ